MKDAKIQWHPAFVAAVNLELAANRDDLIYETEYNLNVKPLEIDLLIIKRKSELEIENEIGRLFRGHNIMEYKAPQDHLDIDTFYKVEAYAALYKAYGEAVDGRKAEDITVSLIREAKPEGLFQYFRRHSIPVGNPYPGIYYVENGSFFPTQIIVTRELEEQNYIWLKALSDHMDKQSMQDFWDKIQGISEKYDRELADAVLEVSIRANQEIVKKLRGDGDMCKALLEIMEPEINQIVEERVEKKVEEVREAVTEEAKRKAKKEAMREAKEEAMKEAKEAVMKEAKKAVMKEAKKEAMKEAKKEAMKEAKKEAISMATKMLKSGKFTAEEILEYIPWLSAEEILHIVSNLQAGPQTKRNG